MKPTKLTLIINLVALAACSSNQPQAEVPPAPTPSATPTPSPSPSLNTPSEKAAFTLAKLDGDGNNYLSYIGYLKQLDKRCQEDPAKLANMTNGSVKALDKEGKQVSHLDILQAVALASEGFTTDGNRCLDVFTSIVILTK